VVVVAVQNTFHLEIHQDDFLFYFLKIIFDISTSKRFKNTKKIFILNIYFKKYGLDCVSKQALQLIIL
jgi:hypothetical protein